MGIYGQIINIIPAQPISLITNSEEDDKLIYTLKQGEQIIGEINIPLDFLLSQAHVITPETKPEQMENDLWKEGHTYLELRFKTTEGASEQIVYIDMTISEDWLDDNVQSKLNKAVTFTDTDSDGNISITYPQ